MKKLVTICLLATVCLLTAMAQREFRVRKNVPTDSIRLSDPAILPDKASQMYYMTGTGGMMWRSTDLKLWEGPFRVTEFKADSWMGPRPMIWAAEPHTTGDGWYYYFATFTNQAVKIDTVRGNVIERRASQVLRADNPMGPYRAFGDATYLPADRPTLDGTYWKDKDGKPYMVFCGEWLQNWNGTIEKIELKPDLSGTVGEPRVLFRASDSPWSREKDEQGNITWNKVTDGPWLFRTATGRLGMLWTSWVYDVYTQGVAYSESGTLDGPWVQEPEPITPPGYGHSMLFQRFDGQWMMSVHHHSKDARGRTVRIPHFFEVDLSGDKLVVKLPEKTKTALTEKDMGAYLFAYFSDPTHSLFLAVSYDGYTFTPVNNGLPIISGDSIAEQHGIRDPHIYRAPNGKFYIAMTDLHIFGKQKGIRTTQWERPERFGWGNNRGLVLMASDDLIHWTHHVARIDKLFPEKFGEIGCAWAPQTIWDPQVGKPMVYFTIRQQAGGRTKLYYSYADEAFTTLETEPQLLFEYPDTTIQVLDADICPMPDGRYFMSYVSQENPGGIKYMISDRINHFDDYHAEQIDAERSGCEAPNMWKRIGEDKWVLMYDIYSVHPHNFGFVETSDFKTFTPLGHFNEGKMKIQNFVSPKHGSVIHITKAEAKRLENYWNEQQKKPKNIRSGEIWRDDGGRHINAHGGGVLKHGDTYYWFGEHKSERTSDALVGVMCYASKDLVNWRNCGVALSVSDERGHDIERGCILERPKVIYNPVTKKFCMWFHLELKGQGYNAARYGVAVADRPEGPYKFLYSQRADAGTWPVEFDAAAIAVADTLVAANYKDWSPAWLKAVDQGLFVKRDFGTGQMSRDMTLYVDDDGKAYHIFSSEENLTLHIAELTDNYLYHSGRYTRVAPAGHNEAPAIFKRDGTYWMITSGCTGWAPNEARMFSAPSIWGPWTQHPNPCRGPKAEITFGGQSTFILPIDGQYIFMADIWRPRHPIDARYIWLPIEFEDGKPVVRWQDEWSPNLIP